MTKLVLVTLSDHLLTLNHIASFYSSLLAVHAISTIFLFEQKKLVSSANKIILSNVDTSHIPFMYKINSTAPRIDPCGTPHLSVVDVQEVFINAGHHSSDIPGSNFRGGLLIFFLLLPGATGTAYYSDFIQSPCTQ